MTVRYEAKMDWMLQTSLLNDIAGASFVSPVFKQLPRATDFPPKSISSSVDSLKSFGISGVDPGPSPTPEREDTRSWKWESRFMLIVIFRLMNLGCVWHDLYIKPYTTFNHVAILLQFRKVSQGGLVIFHPVKIVRQANIAERLAIKVIILNKNRHTSLIKTPKSK